MGDSGTQMIPALQAAPSDTLLATGADLKSPVLNEYNVSNSEVCSVRRFAILLRFPKKAFQEEDVPILQSWVITTAQNANIPSASFRIVRTSSATMDIIASSQFGLPPMHETLRQISFAFHNSKTPDDVLLKSVYGIPTASPHPCQSILKHLEMGFDNSESIVANLRLQMKAERRSYEHVKEEQMRAMITLHGAEVRRERIRLDRRLRYLQDVLMKDRNADLAACNQGWVKRVEEQREFLDAARENAFAMITKELELTEEKIQAVQAMQKTKVAAAQKHLEHSNAAMRDLSTPGRALLPLWMTKEAELHHSMFQLQNR